MGVHFKPGGAFPFLGVTAGELADMHVDLKALWGPSAVKLAKSSTVSRRLRPPSTSVQSAFIV
jgi:hypothetical protein